MVISLPLLPCVDFNMIYVYNVFLQVIVIYQNKSFIELRASAMGACAVS